MTDIIIQGIYGRMGRALVEKIGAREDCRIVAGVDREAGRIGEIPVYAGFDALPCKGVIIDFSAPAGAVAAAQYGAANGLPGYRFILCRERAAVFLSCRSLCWRNRC